MSKEEMRKSWGPLLSFVALALIAAASIYLVPQGIRNGAGVFGILVIVAYCIFVGIVRPENLQGVLAAISTVLGPLIAESFIKLRNPGIQDSDFKLASVIIQVDFLLIGEITVFLFAFEKLITTKVVQGHKKIDVLVALAFAVPIALLLGITPLRLTDQTDIPILGMHVPQFGSMVLFRALLALFGVYLTLRPESPSTSNGTPRPESRPS